ncbi:uL22 family ribosomal protein [Candidatus Carsonella ruddii]|uniref:uL22 family ribosomal protein n=1 Tax=Carsonella ruddii TaxID=114186 RepID=UPI003D3DB1D1
MLNNFKFKFNKISISYRKLMCISKFLSNKPILFYLNIFLLKKFNFFLKKITNIIINNCKTTNVFVKQFLVGKSIKIKKLNFRAKGRINFIVKNFSNIILNVLWEKK